MDYNLLIGGISGIVSRTMVAPVELYRIQKQSNMYWYIYGKVPNAKTIHRLLSCENEYIEVSGQSPY